MKATKKIVGATAALVAALALSAGSTFAWFSANTSVTATGMNVQVTSVKDKNLIISATNSFATPSTTINYADPTKTLDPSTHITGADTYASFAAGLKYVKNPTAVDQNTGLVIDEDTAPLAYAAATENKHYITHVAYLAGLGSEIQNQELTVSIIPGFTANGTQLAISVDFYLGEISADNFKGTLNLAGKASDNSHIGGGVTEVVLSEDMTIPASTGDGQLVTMVIYIDGALEETQGQAYVNSATVVTSAVSFGVQFSIEDAAGA